MKVRNLEPVARMLSGLELKTLASDGNVTVTIYFSSEHGDIREIEIDSTHTGRPGIWNKGQWTKEIKQRVEKSYSNLGSITARAIVVVFYDYKCSRSYTLEAMDLSKILFFNRIIISDQLEGYREYRQYILSPDKSKKLRRFEDVIRFLGNVPTSELKQLPDFSPMIEVQRAERLFKA